jgi:hypothetical protein
MKQGIIFLFINLLIFTSCSCQLVPAWYDTKHNPNRYISLESDGLTLIVENIEVEGRYLAFDVEIINRKSHTVHVSPELMYYYASDAPFPVGMQRNSAGEFESGLTKRYAMGEREVAGEFEARIRKEKRTGLAMGLLSAGLIIFDVAMDAKSMNTGEWTKKKADNAMIRDVITMTGLAVADMAQQVSYTAAREKGEDLFFLRDEILRPEILSSGESCRGKVFFQGSDGRYFKLIILVENMEYAFDFRFNRQ